MDKRILYLKPGRLFTMLIGILLSASLSAHYNIAAKPSYTIAETTSPNPSPPPPTAVTGNWNIAATWTPNGVPGQGDDVTIPNGVTVTIDAAAVCKNITIEAGGTLIISGTNTLTVTGNWTNNGTFDAGLNGTVEFTGSLDAIISGTSTFKFLRFSKDAGKKVTITGSATTASGGNLTLASGSTEISGSLICNHNVNLTIPANVGITINGGTFSTTASIDNNGSFTFNAGTVTVGSVTGNSFFIGNNGTFSISGGTMNVAGRFQVSGGTANISGGTINLNSLGHNSSTIATLDLSLTANFTMTAGTINIVQPNSTGNSDIIIRNSSGTKNFAGGNINVGTGVSATYLITSQVPFPSIITATVNSSLVYRMLVSANGTYNFPLTTNAGSPLPASVTISGAYAAGAYIQISTNQVKHPENKNNSNYLNRFWTVTTSGITSPNYNITAAYADTDIFDDEGKIAVGIWGGSLPWTKQSSVNTTTNTISLTGITAIGLQITGLNSDPPTVNITANPSATICLGASTTLTANATGDPVITYSWSPVTGLSATNISNPVATPASTTTYTVIVTDGNGFTATENIQITVTPNNTVSAASSTPTLCINTPLTNITHTTTGATGIGAPSGLPAGVTASFAANTITISGTPTQSGTFNYSIPLTGGCGTVSATGTINVTPDNTVSAASSTPTLCINTPLTNITHNTTGATGIGTATGLPAGVSATWASNTITISGTPTQSGTFNYTVPLTGGCGTVSATGTITVTPVNTVGAPSSTPTLCINTLLTAITHTTTGATGIGAPTGLPTGVTAAWASNTITISGTPTQSGAFNYSVPLTGGCGSINATGTITVTPVNTVSASSSTPTLCINTPLTAITHTTTGATGIGAPTGLPTGVTVAWASNTITISGTPTQSGTFNYTVPLTGGCGSINATGTITVNPRPVPTITGLNPVCSGSTGITYTTEAGMSGYSWGISAGGTITSGAGTRQITVTWNVAGTQTLQVTYTDANGCTPVSPTILSITVNPTPTVAATPLTQTICPGTTITTITITNPNNVVGTTFSWTRDNTAILTGIPDSETGSTIAGTLNSTAPNVMHTTTFTITASAVGCASSTTTVTVNAGDIIPPTFNAPPNITVNATASCTAPVITPSITGNPTSPADNCPLPANPFTFADSGPVVSPTCPGNFNITRTWTMTDAAGNTATRTQIISVEDKTPPTLTVPPTITIQCGASILPANTGQATATDNCGGTITFSHSDSTPTPGSCANNSSITRTWTATDCAGNISTATQTISIIDNIKPVIISVTNYDITCPADIPAPNIADIVATDNCGTVTIVLWDEFLAGIAGKPGYCPTSITRTYRVTDQCGNFTDAIQTIVIEEECGCVECPGTLNAFREVDLRGNPTGTLTLTLDRADKCCDAKNNEYCASFNVILDDDAVGVQIDVVGVTPQGQSWKKDCKDIPGGSLVCLPSGVYHLFTYCKSGGGQGQLTNTYTFTSVRGITVEEEIQARVDCQGQLTATGITGTPAWTSISPGNPGDYNHYLSDTTIANPTFTPRLGAPPVIVYKVCGTIAAAQCFTGGISCKEVTVYIKDAIDIELNIIPDQVCKNDEIIITPTIYPDGNYTLYWYEGTVLTGTLLHTGPTFEPDSEGLYTVRVVDIQDGIPCSEGTFEFEIEYDNTGPTIQVPPAPLVVECNDPAASQIIINWLASARATYTNAQGVTVTITPDNNYTGISMTCNNIITITFTAQDNCTNVNSATSTITVRDTRAPEWITAPNSLDRTIDCSYNAALLAAQALVPIAYDVCEAGLVPVKTSGTPPSGVCLTGQTIINTWVVTDACGNISATYTQTITIEDDSPPYFTFCPPNDTNQAEDNLCLTNTLVLDDPIATDDCGAVTITWVKTGATTGTGNGTATGPFNVGVTTITYTATDACGNTATCTQQVTIIDNQPPTLGCPPSETRPADHLQNYASNVDITPPTHQDNCHTYSLNWTITNGGNTVASSGISTGVNIVPSPYDKLYLGVNTITYTLDYGAAQPLTCSFTITVTSQPKLICPETPITRGTDPSKCDAIFNPGVPVLDEGAQPIRWNYTITGPDNQVEKTITMTGSVSTPGPPDIGDYAFKVGTTTIVWTATDSFDRSDQCTQTITVIDNQPPTFIPPSPLNECVENLLLAVYNGSDLDIQPVPDHYLHKKGNTTLDLTALSDNCGCPVDKEITIDWVIKFDDDTPYNLGGSTLAGSGQPSEDDIYLWGDGINFTSLVHTITYTVTDCNNVKVELPPVEITVRPRPQIIKN